MLAVMAAGQSVRFGAQDKLAALLGGKMIGLHVPDNLQCIEFLESVIVSAEKDHPCAALWKDSGYHILINKNAKAGQSTSVALAAQYAQSIAADALCICLADTPFLSADLIEQLVSEYFRHDQQKIVASSDGSRAMPPAIFPARLFQSLQSLNGDQGARSLLSSATTVTSNASHLLDIDTPGDLAMAEKILRTIDGT